MRDYLGLIEWGLFSFVVLGVLGWQYWLVRDAGRAKDSPDDARHPPGEHETDDG